MQAISPTFVVSTGPLATADDAHRLYRARVLAGNSYSTRTHGTICIGLNDTGWLEIVPERRPSDRVVAKSAVACSAPHPGVAVSDGCRHSCLSAAFKSCRPAGRLGPIQREIAQRLAVSEGTVKTHVANILRKLEVRDRVHAIIYAYESGEIEAGR